MCIGVCRYKLANADVRGMGGGEQVQSHPPEFTEGCEWPLLDAWNQTWVPARAVCAFKCGAVSIVLDNKILIQGQQYTD